VQQQLNIAAPRRY